MLRGLFNKETEETEVETKNPDFYCKICGADSESGGQPSICNDCFGGDSPDAV